MASQGLTLVVLMCFVALGSGIEIFEDQLQGDTTPHIHSRFAYVTWTKEKGYAVQVKIILPCVLLSK